MHTRTETKYFSQTSWRTLQVLEALARNGGEMGLSELARAVGCPKTSLFSIVRTMEQSQFIDFGERGYRLGFRVLEIAQAYKDQSPLERVFREVGEPAVAEQRETLQMAVLEGTDIVYVAKIESDRAVRLVSDVGRRLPAHATALGKVLLAYAAVPDLKERYSGVLLEPLTARSLRTFDELESAVERAREEGFAEDFEEVSEGLWCAAAPIRDSSGFAVAAVSFSVPSSRVDDARWRQLREALKRLAYEIEKKIGAQRAA